MNPQPMDWIEAVDDDPTTETPITWLDVEDDEEPQPQPLQEAA